MYLFAKWCGLASFGFFIWGEAETLPQALIFCRFS